MKNISHPPAPQPRWPEPGGERVIPAASVAVWPVFALQQ